MRKEPFNTSEKKLIVGMSLLTFIRMLGVTMVLPVFSIFATGLEKSIEPLPGIAFGAFSFSQVIFQVPFGKLSDRWGKKEATLFGFILYFIGTVFSGLSHNVYQLILARCIAGAGAVGGVTMAWLTEGIESKRRNFAIAFLGISYGLSAIVSFTLSPIIAGTLGIPSVFYINAGLSFLAIIFVIFFLENNGISFTGIGVYQANSFWNILKNRELLRINIAGFIANFVFSSLFFVLPILFTRAMGVADMWKIYAPATVIGTALMILFARIADKKKSIAPAWNGFACELTGIGILFMTGEYYMLISAFLLIYTGHCILSPVFPVVVSLFPGKSVSGMVMSIFTSFQFLGAGAGAIVSDIFFRSMSHLLYIMLMMMLIAGIGLIFGLRHVSRDGFSSNSDI